MDIRINTDNMKNHIKDIDSYMNDYQIILSKIKGIIDSGLKNAIKTEQLYQNFNEEIQGLRRSLESLPVQMQTWKKFIDGYIEASESLDINYNKQKIILR